MNRHAMQIALALSALLAPLAPAQAQEDAVVFDTEGLEHFVVTYRREDFREDIPDEEWRLLPAPERQRLWSMVTPTRLKRCKEWLELSYDKEIEEMGFEKPAGRMEDGRIRVDLRNLGDPTVCGSVDLGIGILNLNLEVFWLRGQQAYNRGQFVMASTICHELFHAIQAVYDPAEDLWLMEATAMWMESQVFPDNHDPVVFERNFVKCLYLSLCYPRNDYDLDTGRPYGGSVFFRFLTAHHPDGQEVVRKIWERCKRRGRNAPDALVETLNARGPTEFRDYFDRFAVGALMLHEAPDDCKLVDARWLQHPHIAFLSTLSSRHYSSGFRGPDSATFEMRFPRGGRFPDGAKHGWVYGMGVRHFGIGKPPDLPPATDMFVGVKGPKEDIAVQGVAQYEGGWKIFRARYSDASRGYVLRIPHMDKTTYDAAYVLVTRHGPGARARVYPMTIGAPNPPALKTLKVHQKGKIVADMRWEDVRDGDGLLLKRVAKRLAAGRLKGADGDGRLQLVFSQPVRPKGGEGGASVCMFNGIHPLDLRSAVDGRVWVGTIPKKLYAGRNAPQCFLINAEAAPAGTRAVMPLDEKPTTAAHVGFGNWTGYERTGKGMIVDLEVGKPKFSVRIFRPHRRGPVRGYVGFWKAGRRGTRYEDMDWDQPVLLIAKLGDHVQYMYPSNAKAYAGTYGKWASFSGLDIPAGQLKRLPEKLHLTAVLPDGKTYKETVTIKYVGEEGGSGKFDRDRCRRARQLYGAAMKKRPKTREDRRVQRVRILSGAEGILKFSMDPDEVQQLADRLNKMGLTKSEVIPLIHARLAGSVRRREAGKCLAMLKALRTFPGEAHPYDYACAVRLLVKKQNNIAAARVVLGWYKKDRPRWNLKGKGLCEHYNAVVKQGIPLPKKAIQPPKPK